MKKIFFAILFLFAVNTYSQLSKTHYIPPLSNSVQLAPKWQFMYISTPSSTDVHFKITNIGGEIIKGTVSRDQPYALDLGTGTDTQLIVNKFNVSKVLKNKGFIVEAEDLVYVNVRVTATPEEYHASSVVSKGLAALGTKFRIGAFTNKSVASTSDAHYTFASILATENNTIVSFGDIKTGVSLVNNASVGNFPPQITLNRGESFVMAVEGTNVANRDGLIGASISSNKPIAVNCGSFGGTNGDLNNLDLGFDQIVPAERIGDEYIFVKGNGVEITEKPLIIANENNTEIYVNGSYFTTLDEGKYITLEGKFSAEKNLYVKGSKKFFAYQGLGGTPSQPNQNMHFMPPLSCETPKSINNIPLINEVGNNKDFIATVNIVTEKGAVLNFFINGNSYTLTTLPAGITSKGPSVVTGNDKYVTYTLGGLKGNVSVLADKQVYLSYFGSSEHATYGGYYSGFAYNPEINFGKAVVNEANCLPNVKLSVNALSSFEEFQWFYNGDLISGATTNSLTPENPGFYHVKANVKGCAPRFSDSIPVSVCLEDSDGDGVNDYVDIDNDNDGITNCDESLGSVDLDLTADTGSVSKGDYFNSFNRVVSFNGNSNSMTFGGDDGTIISQVSAGLANSLTQTFTFAKPISLVLEYVKFVGATNLLNSNGDFVLEVPNGNIIMVLNPDDQLLIDTNYDGVYESGVTEYSSFQIRFRLKDLTNPLAAGTGTFKFLTNLVSSFSITHKNLSETKNNNAAFKLSTSCLPKDSDDDGLIDEMDDDDDNDRIPTLVEVLGKDYKVVPFIDANKNGMNDIYETGLGTLDSDNDGVANYLDLDSDNDGIYDLVEAGQSAYDTNNNGVIDGSEIVAPLNTSFPDNDSDGFSDFIDSDSDGDGCFDVVEAGFTDPDGDGYLGNSPVTVDTQGKVTSAFNGYTLPVNDDYIINGSIVVTNFPADQTACVPQNVNFTVTANADTYQWQVSVDGNSFSDIADNEIYSGSTTSTLQLTNVALNMNGYKYRLVLNKKGNSCGFISPEVSLTVVTSKPIKIENIAVSDLNDNIQVIVTTTGSGKYEYALDSVSGPFQDSNVFQNVEPGIHDVYVRDIEGCGQASKSITAVGVPSYFTPNGDGVNEIWSIKGINSQLYNNSKVEIFDRYGKLVYVVASAQSEGWDGTLNGSPLPATDYWFVLYLGDGRTGKGHFSLKR